MIYPVSPRVTRDDVITDALLYLGALNEAFIEWEQQPNLYSPAFAARFLRANLDKAVTALRRPAEPADERVEWGVRLNADQNGEGVYCDPVSETDARWLQRMAPERRALVTRRGPGPWVPVVPDGDKEGQPNA